MLRSRQRVAQKHCDRHRSHAARNRGHEASHFEDRGVDVAHQPCLRSVHADVDHGCSGLHHLRSDDPGTADSRHENIRSPRVLGEACGARVADRHRRMLGEKQHRHGLPDDLASSDDDGLLALELHTMLGEHHHHPRRRRRHEERLAEKEEPCVRRMEPVDVFRRVDRAKNLRLVHVLRERKLDENPVDVVVNVQLGDEIEDLVLRRVGREAMVARVDACLVRGLVLAADVDVRSGVISDEDRREADGLPECLHIVGHLGPNLRGESLSVDASRSHRADNPTCGRDTIALVSERTSTPPGLTPAERGSLVLTDISGYTTYLLGTELEHAQDVLADLMGIVLVSLQPVLRVTKLEGDAVFAYALDGTCGASTLLDTIEQAYFGFRARLRDIAHATTCTCDACRQIPTLDLKFVVHHGSFVRREIGGNEELTGSDVIIVHRLLKNSAGEAFGTRGYVLLTDACVEALRIDPEALGLRPHSETYDDVGVVQCCFEDLGERWNAEREKERVYVASGDASFECTVTVPFDAAVVWDWLTSPERRSLWQADKLELMTPGGRERAGVTNHCMHGEDVVIEHVVDWRPFDYFTVTYDFPGVDAMHWTTELAPGDGVTTVRWRGEALTRDRLEAWKQIEPDVVGGLEHSAALLVEQLN